MIRHYIQAFRATLQKIKAKDGVYIKSENIIVYDPDHIISEIPENGLITRQNAEDLIGGSATPPPIFIDIPTGSPIPFVFNMTPYISYIGLSIPRPILILDPTPGSKQFKFLNDVDIISKPDSSPPTLEIYGHEDPDNPGFTIDDIFVNVYKV